MNLKVAKNIILAQIASDGAKGIFKLNNELASGSVAAYRGYDAKDKLILHAIRGINRDKNSGFYYSVIRAVDEYKNNCYIVYFHFKINEEKYTVAFHTFDTVFGRFVKRPDKCYDTWYRPSRESTEALINFYQNNTDKEFDL